MTISQQCLDLVNRLYALHSHQGYVIRLRKDIFNKLYLEFLAGNLIDSKNQYSGIRIKNVVFIMRKNK